MFSVKASRVLLASSLPPTSLNGCSEKPAIFRTQRLSTWQLALDR